MRTVTMLALVMVLTLSGCTTQTRYDTNVEVPKGDAPFPTLTTSWVIDSAGIINDKVDAKIDQLFQQLKEDRIAEVVIVTMNGVHSPDVWATHFGRKILLGSRGMSGQGGNNGIVWLIRPDGPADAMMTISVGRGLPKFSSSEMMKIMTNAAPAISMKNFDQGALELATGTDAALRRLYKKEGSQ